MEKYERFRHRNKCFNDTIAKLKSPYRIRVKEKLLEIAKNTYKILVVSNKDRTVGFHRFIKDKKYQSLVSIGDHKNNYLPILAHEIGHAITLKKHPILNKLNNWGRKWESKSEFSGSLLRELFMAKIIYGFVVYSEIIASRKGLELLKKCGYGREDLKYAEKYYKLALGTYISTQKYLINLYS